MGVDNPAPLVVMCCVDHPITLQMSIIDKNWCWLPAASRMQFHFEWWVSMLTLSPYFTLNGCWPPHRILISTPSYWELVKPPHDTDIGCWPSSSHNDTENWEWVLFPNIHCSKKNECQQEPPTTSAMMSLRLGVLGHLLIGTWENNENMRGWGWWMTYSASSLTTRTAWWGRGRDREEEQHNRGRKG